MSLRNIRVFPHWGGGSLVLSWEFDEDPEPDHGVVVYSGLTAGSDWKNVTEEGVLDRDSRTFVHKSPLSLRSMHEAYYRIVIQTGGRRWDSPSVRPDHTLTPHEFATIRQMLALEHQNMRAGNGHPVLLLKPLTHGDYSDSHNPDTGQIMNPTTDESGYGERFRGGYSPPMKSYARFRKTEDRESPNEKGKGVDVNRTVTARMFCFPTPARRDLVVDPATDERYMVEGRQVYRFRGLVPLMCDAQLRLLERGDVRYKLDVGKLSADD